MVLIKAKIIPNSTAGEIKILNSREYFVYKDDGGDFMAVKNIGNPNVDKLNYELDFLRNMKRIGVIKDYRYEPL